MDAVQAVLARTARARLLVEDLLTANAAALALCCGLPGASPCVCSCRSFEFVVTEHLDGHRGVANEQRCRREVVVRDGCAVDELHFDHVGAPSFVARRCHVSGGACSGFLMRHTGASRDGDPQVLTPRGSRCRRACNAQSMRDGPDVGELKPLQIVIQIMPGGLSFVMASRWWSRGG